MRRAGARSFWTRYETLEEIERRYFLRVVEALGGERAKVARVLGIDRKTLLRKLDRYGVGASQT